MSIERHARLIIGHFGSLYRDRDFGVLLDVCASLTGRGMPVSVRWYGDILGDHPMRPMLEKHIAQGTLQLSERVPHHLVRDLMQECDLLLVVPSPQYREELTTKLYDYLDAGRPILGLAHSGSLLEAFLAQARVGRTFSPDDATSLTSFLASCITRGASFEPNHEFLQGQRTESLGRSMVELLGRLT